MSWCIDCEDCPRGCGEWCGDCTRSVCNQCSSKDEFDADELGLDPEEEFDA